MKKVVLLVIIKKRGAPAIRRVVCAPISIITNAVRTLRAKLCPNNRARIPAVAGLGQRLCGAHQGGTRRPRSISTD